jgi:hypothetical protein
VERRQLQHRDAADAVERLRLFLEAARIRHVCDIREGEAEIRLSALQRLQIAHGARAFLHVDDDRGQHAGETVAQSGAERMKTGAGDAAGQTNVRGRRAGQLGRAGGIRAGRGQQNNG